VSFRIRKGLQGKLRLEIVRKSTSTESASTAVPMPTCSFAIRNSVPCLSSSSREAEIREELVIGTSLEKAEAFISSRRTIKNNVIAAMKRHGQQNEQHHG
jgi:hypothetical protein